MGNRSDFYQNIDMQRTGDYLRWLIMGHGYTVKEIQNWLRLACPQPVYRWMRGEILPSVNHLYMLSRLFHLHMEELLICIGQDTGTQETVLQNKKVERITYYYYAVTFACKSHITMV